MLPFVYQVVKVDEMEIKSIMKDLPCIYVPTLHPALVPDFIPDTVSFICPGLSSRNADELRQAYVPAGLPFQPAEPVLQELLELGMQFGQGGDLKLLAGQGWLERDNRRQEQLRAELRELENFADGAGNAASGTFRPEYYQNINEELGNAHKVLLLAWELEECRLDIAGAELLVALGGQRLSATLSDGMDASGDDLEAMSGLSEADSALPQNSWRTTLDALAAFLPEQALLLTADPEMTNELRELGIMRPLPKGLGSIHAAWSEEFLATLLWCRHPLWQILGYSDIPVGRPWLAASYDLLCVSRSPNAARG